MARYFRRNDGQTRWYWCTAIANMAAPTAAEINVGIALAARIADISGFTYKNKPIETPDLSSAFVSTIGGEDQAEDSGLILYDDDTSMALWNALPRNTAGFMVINPYARVGGTKCRVWPVVSLGQNDEFKTDATAAKFLVDFSVSIRPNLDAAFPSGVTI